MQEWGEWMELGHEGWLHTQCVCVELRVGRVGVGVGVSLVLIVKMIIGPIS